MLVNQSVAIGRFLGRILKRLPRAADGLTIWQVDRFLMSMHDEGASKGAG